MIKLIVSDLDGTLFDEAHKLNETTAVAIQKAKTAGIEFMVATGRSKENVLPYFEEYSIDCAKILLNGAMYINEKDDVEHSIPMQHEDIRHIYHFMQAHDVVVHLFYAEGIACNDPDKMLSDFKLRLKTKEHMTDEDIEDMITTTGFCQFDAKIEDLDEFLLKNPLVYKMEAFANDEVVIQEIREHLGAIKHLEISNSVGDNIEITDVQAQKGWMLERICKQMGIAKEEVITIGDSMNDLSMIRDFPNSFAMANACDQIKEVATWQAAANYENGVAAIIEKIVAKQSR